MSYSDYLLVPSVGQSNKYVRLLNNATAQEYVSTAATGERGVWTLATKPVPGTYTIYIGPTATGPWTVTDDTGYVITPDLNTDASVITSLGVQAAGANGKAADAAHVHSSHLPGDLQLDGHLGMGVAPSSGAAINLMETLVSAGTVYAVKVNPTFQAGVAGDYGILLGTQTAVFSVPTGTSFARAYGALWDAGSWTKTGPGSVDRAIGFFISTPGIGGANAGLALNDSPASGSYALYSASGANYFGGSVRLDGGLIVGAASNSTTASAGTGGAPPAQVKQYLAIVLSDGNVGKIPVYAA